MSGVAYPRPCSKCGEPTARAEFVKDSSRACGHKGWCRACDRLKSRAYYGANREDRATYYQANREHKLAMVRAWKARQPPEPPKPPKLCVDCGASMPPRSRGGRCADCRRVPCARCGALVYRRPNELERHARTYCSHPCRLDALAEQRREIARRSVRKGRELVGPVVRTILIAGPTMPLTAKPEQRMRRAGYCIICGTACVSDGMWSLSVCSDKCGRRLGYERTKAKGRGKRKRKGKWVGPPVWRTKIYERDGWRCRLCGKVVRKDKAVPHPLAPVLDHIVPDSMGGDWSYENLQTAHFRCNSRKGARGHADHRPDQLLLVGR